MKGLPLDAQLRTGVEGIAWPAIPGRAATELLAQLHQLGQSEWWPEQQLRARQLEQFGILARHARAHSDFYGRRFAAASIAADAPWNDDMFRALPMLTRGELLTEASAIDCRTVPKSHGAVRVTKTSGSTGQIVSVRRTAVNQLTWLALNMRDHIWHQRDFAETLAVIRAHTGEQDDEEAARKMGWGPPATLLYSTGPCYTQSLATDVSRQVEWLLRRDPGYVLTYPTNLAALLSRFEQSGKRLARLRQVRTVGETLTAELRERCHAVLGVPIVDNYSSQEVGAIALQCPESGLYHVQAESLIVEVLDADGRAVRPGQVGRLVVTDLHNFATPLIRYELRDRAEVGPACPCGRGLPTLSRILGRERNMLVLPSGERHWPLVGFRRYDEIGQILQYQLVQHSLEEVEVRLVTGSGSLSPVQERRMTELVQEALKHPFRIRFSYFEGELERGSGGKFEEFVSLVSA